MPRSGYGKDVLEVEGYVRGFARRRPDVAVTMLRAANTVGPGVVSPLTQYFRLPLVPTVLGFDARLQFLHETDLLGALQHATVAGVHGTFNVAGDGVLMLSQALRRIGRPTLPVPTFAIGPLASVSRQTGIKGLPPELAGYLTFGRGLDTTRMRGVLGYSPSFTTAEAFADFGRTIAPSPVPRPITAAVTGAGTGGGNHG
jgi:UDP-glucose 4-epimerase